jgi:peptide/nickel transport system ATP-binding protein
MPEITPTPGSEVLLTVEDLHVSFPGPRGAVAAVRGVTFKLGRERLAVVGESGSGKTMLGRAIMRLLPREACLRAQSLRFGTTDLLRATEKELRVLRGARIGMILQDPRYSLNPTMTVGDQIAEAYLAHRHASKSEARQRSIEMLESVYIRDPIRVYNLYAHEVSGGMGQRIMIAMMLIPGPDLLIADEPTSALDVTVRNQVLAVLDECVTQRGLGLIFISHDLNLVSTFCDRVLVMYAGQMVEECAANRLNEAKHPYTIGLLAASPHVEAPRARLPVLERDPTWLTGSNWA